MTHNIEMPARDLIDTHWPEDFGEAWQEEERARERDCLSWKNYLYIAFGWGCVGVVVGSGWLLAAMWGAE